MSALARYYNHAGAVVAGYDRVCSKLTSERKMRESASTMRMI